MFWWLMKKKIFDCELVEWPLICGDVYQHRWMGGSRCQHWPLKTAIFCGQALRRLPWWCHADIQWPLLHMILISLFQGDMPRSCDNSSRLEPKQTPEIFVTAQRCTQQPKVNDKLQVCQLWCGSVHLMTMGWWQKYVVTQVKPYPAIIPCPFWG